MSSGGSSSLQPTFTGHVSSTLDALVLFEACLQGHLSHVPRRPHDRERSTLIRSGSVFIYEENASGIKRWTDGVTWSPSRILGNFLVYRELDKPFPPGEKKRAMKKQHRRPSRPGEPYARPEQRQGEYPATSPTSPFGERGASEAERQLIGSLVDSYGFKKSGLVKKTMSVTVQGVTHHLVSYYTIEDVLEGRFRTPSQTDNLQYVRPRAELTQKQSFRAPIEEVEDIEALNNGQSPYGFRMSGQGYQTSQYYMPSPYAPPMGGQPPLNGSYPGPVPPMAPGYLQSPVSTPQLQQQDRGQYPPYDQANYNRNMPPTPTNSAPSSLPDRSQQSQNLMYPPTSMGVSRPVPTLSPVSMDSRHMSYRPTTYGNMSSVSSPVDAQRQTQPSPAERRDPPYYPGQSPQSYSQQWPGTHPPQ